MKNASLGLRTITEIARQLGCDWWRAAHIIKRDSIPPVARFGRTQVFDQAAFEHIKEALDTIDREKREVAHA